MDLPLCSQIFLCLFWDVLRMHIDVHILCSIWIDCRCLLCFIRVDAEHGIARLWSLHFYIILSDPWYISNIPGRISVNKTLYYFQMLNSRRLLVWLWSCCRWSAPTICTSTESSRYIYVFSLDKLRDPAMIRILRLLVISLRRWIDQVPRRIHCFRLDFADITESMETFPIFTEQLKSSLIWSIYGC